MSESLKQKIEASGFFKGELFDDATARDKYSRDASLFEVQPQLVAFPADSADIQALVKFVGEQKTADPAGNAKLSITARSAGTCMSGGSLNESIILDVTKHIGRLVSLSDTEAVVEPGMYYRDFETETLKRNVILPCYTASKNLCALGGMISNNAAGEKTLQYGKMENYVRELRVIFADGNEYTVKPLTRAELDAKMAQQNFEGRVYKEIFELIEKNRDAIAAAKPQVSKNSAGYYLWNVWDPQGNNGAGLFDLTRLIVGSQGTLGIVTQANIKLVPVKPLSGLFVVFMPTLEHLGDIVDEILPFQPESVESYDDSTMKLAVKFMPEMLRTMHTGNFIKLMLKFLPEVGMMLVGGIPKLVLLTEFSGATEAEIDEKMAALKKKIAHFGFKMHATRSAAEAEKYWTIRRESFNLLRKHIRGARTAPFVDDVVVRPEFLPEFLPKMRKILDDYKLTYTIAGHAGNGNFHIIPLMDMRVPRNRAIIREISDKIYDLVISYKGSITGEHNDGIVRTPYLEKMYGSAITALFAQTKHIFDPQGMFNPGKKVGGTIEYMESHLAKA